MSEFRLSHLAERDLDEIADYVAGCSPSAAIREIEVLFERFALLASQPLMGQLRDDLPSRPRAFSSGNYLILYRPTIAGIEVARVIHAARDVAAILRQQIEKT
jgi:toxin ParE1/3/4